MDFKSVFIGLMLFAVVIAGARYTLNSYNAGKITGISYTMERVQKKIFSTNRYMFF